MEGVIYAKTFEIFEGLQYPDDARVKVYVSANHPPIYLEVEVKAPVIELSASGGKYTFVENWWAARVRSPMLDINSVGVVAEKLAYDSSMHRLSGIYGIFYKGTAQIVCIDVLGRILTKGQTVAVSPLVEFQLRKIIDIPDSTKTIEVRIHNTQNVLVGILDIMEYRRHR